MKVTIDRLETEKQDLYEEIRETKVNILILVMIFSWECTSIYSPMYS